MNPDTCPDHLTAQEAFMAEGVDGVEVEVMKTVVQDMVITEDRFGSVIHRACPVADCTWEINS